MPGKGIAETARLIASLELKDKLGPGIASASRSLGKLEGRLGRLGSIASKGMATAARNIATIGKLAAVGAAGVFVGAVQSAIDWESAVAGVNKTIDATPGELQAIVDGLRDISRTTPVAATDLAAIAEAGGALGIAKDDILEFTRVVALIGTTTNVTTDEAATALGQLQNVIGLTGADFDNFAASLVDLGNKGASTEAQILEIARRSGSAAKLFGIGKDATLGWASAAANLGMQEELAGTALQNLFLKSMPLFMSASKKMRDVTGKTGAALKQAFEKDAGGAMEMLISKIAELPKNLRLEATQKMFGKGAGLTRLVLGLADSYDRNLVPSLNTARTAWDKNTAAADEAAKRYATTAAQIQVLRNNVKDAAVTIGSALLPELIDLSKEATGWIQGHQPEIKAFAKDLAGGFRAVVGIARSLPWAQIGQSLQLAGAGAKAVIGAFMAMPAWVQTAVTTGWGLNKLTGGALSGIVGELGKGLIRGVLGLNAGVVHAKAGVVNVIGGAGVGGGLLPGMGKGGFTEFMKNLGALTIAAGSLVLLAEQWDKFQKEGAAGAATLRTQTDVGVPQLTLQQARDALRNTQEQLSNPINDLALMLSGTRDEVKRTEKLLQDRIAFLEAGGQPSVEKPSGVTGGRGDAGTAARVVQQGIRAGIYERAVAKTGKAPTERALAGTAHLNENRDIWQRAVTAGMGPPAATITDGLADNAAKIATASAIAARAMALLQTITNMRLATIAAKDFSPKITVPVYVTSTVSVRGMSVAQSVRAAYNHGFHAPGAGR